MRPGVRVPDGFEPLLVSLDKARWLWSVWKQHRYLSDDSQYPPDLTDEENFRRFMGWLSYPSTLLFTYEEHGILGLHYLMPGVSAMPVILFTDKKLKGREQLAQEMARWAIQRFNLRKLVANICERNVASIRFSLRCGMIEEGRLRQSWPKDGIWYDTIVHGGLAEEVMAWVPPQVDEPELAVVGKGA